ncbi:protein translocase subunit SecF, partial [Candidatus Peregrinibacteria bacterium]|nr:protein translocase subunit SecF [Candidatus Peregrinibacteria bacterium]
MQIIKQRNIWFIFSGTLFILSVLALLVWGLKFGVDFTGGTLLEIKFKNTPERLAIQETLKGIDLDAQIQLSDTGNVILRMPPLNEDQHQNVLQKLNDKFGELNEEKFDSIGPTVGQELKNKSVIAVVLVTLMVLFYIAWAFRHVARPVPSMVYGAIVVLTFVHDVTIPLGVFAWLGHFKGVEIN